MPRAEHRQAQRRRDPQSVAESEARQRALLDALPDGVVLQDADGTVLVANDAARRLLDLPPDGGPGRSAPPGPVVPSRSSAGATGAAAAVPVPVPRRGAPESDLRLERLEVSGPPGGTDPLDPHLPGSPAAAAVRTGEPQVGVVVPVDRADGRGWVSVTAIPLLDDDGRPRALVSTLSDVRRGDDDGLRQVEDTFRRTLQHSPIGIAVAGLDGRFQRVNRTLCRMLGYRADELQERTLHDVLHPGDLADTGPQFGDLMGGRVDVVQLEGRLVGRGGMTLWAVLSLALVRDETGGPLHLVIQVQDRSEIRRAHELLTHMALHDPLTGLPNRTLVLDRVQQALERARRSGRRVAVLLCDLDQFRVINDNTGHERGDEVLAEVARRITGCLRPADSAGRIGADEFVVVCDEVVDDREAVGVAERVQAEVSRPILLAGRELVTSMSVGIAVSSDDADPVRLLRDAGIAADRAKERGRGQWDLVDERMRRRATERLDIENALRAGLSAGELRLHFQPIVDVRTRGVVGREALLRWEHPQRGLLAPGEFLQVAEDSGLIGEIGGWVVREAARAAAAAPGARGYVSVNVSPHQVARPGLTETVEKALAEAGLPPSRMRVELTESVVLSAAPAARQEIEQLDDLGVRIVVDDFGTGFSALSYLRDLPVSGIKVDRGFTSGLGNDAHCERIIEALTGLGRGLGVDVIVEGVETEAQRDLLDRMGAEHAQGYLFGRPGPRFDAAVEAGPATPPRSPSAGHDHAERLLRPRPAREFLLP